MKIIALHAITIHVVVVATLFYACVRVSIGFSVRCYLMPPRDSCLHYSTNETCGSYSRSSIMVSLFDISARVHGITPVDMGE